MNNTKVLGLALLLTPFLIVIGLILNSPKFWVGVDVVVFLTTSVIGLALLFRKHR